MAIQSQYPSSSMAIQSQYPSSDFKLVRNNALEEFLYHQSQRGDNTNTNLFASCNNNHGQNILNGTVFSEPESELTCNNISVSRKRNRQDHFHHHQQQQQPKQMLHHPLQISQQQQQLILSKLGKEGHVLDTTTASASVSCEDNRLNGSGATSTSGRSSSMLSPFLLMSYSQDINSNLLLQNLEMDALIQLQNEKLRSELEQTRKKHCRSLLSVIEHQVLTRLEEKEIELANASRRNTELQERIKQMSAENQIWFNIAKNNEVIASNIRSSLEQIILQNQDQNHGQQIREGFGDSSDGIADDAQSYCNQPLAADEEDQPSKTIHENIALKQQRCCKVCRHNDISVLLLPCRHLCVCKDCELNLDTCPICKSVKKACLQVFIS